MENLSGQVIKAYELQDMIGEGGFGAVYRAHQQIIGREVAIKIILPQYANRPEFIRRFETEAQLVARLEHPHIVPLYDYWREPSGAYLVMRWLRGGSIQDLVEQTGQLNVKFIGQVLNHVCEALTVAHRQGVIHRDLKPENILLDEDHNAYLSDFGIAKDIGSSNNITQPNAILGSPSYLSPEQIRGETISPQSDIYSLGIVLYEMLTGDRPFVDNNPATLMYKHLSEPLPDITLADIDLPGALNTVLQRATAKDPTDRFENVIDFAREYRAIVKSIDGGEMPDINRTAYISGKSTGSIIVPDPENPYKGLRAFQQADSEDFFGREVLTLSILRRMQEPTTESRFLAIVGPSGSGKSSVVKAGVLPELRRGAFPGSENWFIVEMLPGLDPMEELEAALLRIAVNPPDSLLDQLNADERGLLRATKRVLPDDDTELLIFIDQFEELFTLVDDEETRKHFMDSLIVAVTDPRSRIRVIATLRADFYDRPLQYNRFGELMRARTEIVLPLSAEELERAITGPAKRVGLHIEDPLVTAIVADVNEQPGALPLLQYALTELFERRDGPVLSLEIYNEINGTFGALARRADELYDGLTEEAQEATRQMFLRLVTLGEGTEDTRRRVRLAELNSIGDDPDEIEMVIDAFGRYRLLTFDRDPVTRTATVEVAHEALIRQWQRLRDWLDESRSDLRTQRRLTAIATEWANAKQDASYLARGTRLQQLETWYENTALALNEQERAFLEASIQERKRRDAEEEARIAREAELEKRSQDRLRALLAVMSVAAAIAIFLAIFAFSQQQAADDARQDAEQAAALELDARTDAERNAAQARGLALAANARNALIENEMPLALSLAIAANDAAPETANEVLRVLASAVFSPGVRARFDDHDNAPLSGDISPDNSLIASAAADGRVNLYDMQNRELVTTFTFDDEVVTVASFSPDGDTLLVAGTGQTLYLADAITGEIRQTFEGHTETITSAQFNADGTRIVSGAVDRTIRLWDANTGENLLTMADTGSVVFEVGFSPDGERLVSSHGDPNITGDDPRSEWDRSVRVWDADTGEQTHRFQLNSGWVRTVTFSPDGDFVAAATWDSTLGGTIRIFDLETSEEVQRIFGHTNLITGIEYTPTGTEIVSVSWDRTMRVWDVSRGVEVTRFDVFEEFAQDVALSPNGEYAVSFTGNIGGNEILRENDTSIDTSIWLIDLRNRAQIREYTGHLDWAWSTTVTPDGRYAFSGSGPLNLEEEEADTSVRIFDIATGEQLQRFALPHANTVEALTMNPAGDLLVSGDWDGLIALWDFDVQNGTPTLSIQQRLQYPADARVLNAAFSPDGTLLATSGSDGQVALWDVATGDLIRSIGDHTGAVAGIAFTSDGSRIATGSWDQTAALWDVTTGERLMTFTGHTALINDIAMMPNDAALLTAGWDLTVRQWDLATGEELSRFVGHTGNVQTVDVSTDGQVALSGGADTTVRLWNIETGQEIIRYNDHTDWVSQAMFMPDGTTALTSGQDNTLRYWRLPTSPAEILQWAESERYIRELTCAEREQFRVEPLCRNDAR